MTNGWSITVLLLGALLTSACCGTKTGDPSKGGLFCWSRDLSEARLREREQRVQRLLAENADLTADVAGLTSAQKHVQSRISNLAQGLLELDAKLARLRADEAVFRQVADEREQEVDRLLVDLEELHEAMTPTTFVDLERLAELERRRAELDALLGDTTPGVIP